ncbi:TonB-dependent receptor plug domain-containing protein [Inhella sp.]|uniref:TonB-dependent receptor plug domain-containing protein n=1 Tax=Inhella sp. TaxID=1921806 RepID=UPI0035B4E032
MQSKWHRPSLAALAVMALVSQQQAYAQASNTQSLEKVVVTGSLIKRTDKETPSVVQSISRQDIQNSGYATIEELLRANGAVDASSIQDGAASGFVSGLATISLRGFGSQGTLVLVNGRRLAPAAAVDINFGRGTLISVNSIPKGAIERIDILKDGASALYGSDAMAGVVNYILRRDYEGMEANASYMQNGEGVGKTYTGGFSFGFGNLDSKGFNVFGGLEVSHRDPVMHNQLKKLGNLDLHNQYTLAQVTTGTSSFLRFTPDSVASPYASYYRVPASNTGSTTIDGRTVNNNSPFGQHYLGTYPGCAPENTVGQGVANRPAGLATGTGSAAASYRTGQCRFSLDDADEAISEQDRLSASLSASLALGKNFTLTADAMLSKTKTVEAAIGQTLTTAVVSTANRTATTWPILTGQLKSQDAIILPVGHPDNPTNSSATPIPVQVIYRFADLNQKAISELNSSRFTLGLQGTLGEWDLDTAVVHSRQDNTQTRTNRLRSSLLNQSIAAGTYRFNGQGNTAAAIASVASDAVIEGESTITSFDVRASRDLFKMAGGNAAVALGLEYRKEELASLPSDIYKSGDFIGLVANGASGDRTLTAGFAEFRLPVVKSVEVQAAVRHEKYSDFGNATTGKLGAKWAILPSTLALRGTVATGFRAPSISQISDAFLLSFHNFQEYAVRDPIRCPNGTSIGVPTNTRDCNLLGRSATSPNPGSLASIISANPNLKAEESKSATAGIIFSPTRNLDVAIDAWYFERNNEIRVQRGVDVLEAYIANQAANAANVLRDPNPATWVPGIDNSGPILAIRRQYGNFKWTKTSGVDYDFTFRLPVESLGRLSFKLNGTYTPRFDQLVRDGATIDKWGGTSSADIPRTKATFQVRLDRDNWNVWGRLNHQDKMRRIGITESCLTATTGGNGVLAANGGCYVGREQTVDVGFSFSPLKGLRIAGSVVNALNDYGRSTNIPYTFSYWDQGTTGQLGRRFNLSATYTMD